MVNRFRIADEMRDLAPPARRRSDMVLTIGRSGSERNKIMNYSIEAGPARKQMIFLPPLYKIIMEWFVDRPFSQVDIMDFGVNFDMLGDACCIPSKHDTLTDPQLQVDENLKFRFDKMVVNDSEILLIDVTVIGGTFKNWYLMCW